MNLRLLSLIWQNEHFTYNSVAVKCAFSKLISMLKGIPRITLMTLQIA